jgi:DNA-binding Lrp family transcriptional regulator
MKTKSILALLLFLGFGSTFAQIKNFNLSDYKLPNLERHSLETSFGLSGSNYYSRFPESSMAYEPTNTTSNGYEGDVALDYGYYLNNSEIQRNVNMCLSFRSMMSNSKEDGELDGKSSSQNPSFYCNIENRKYYQPNNFIELDLNLSYMYRGSEAMSRYYNPSNDEYNKSESKFQNHNASVFLPVKIGRGRIEPVQDARHAVYLLDELMKVDRLVPVDSSSDIIALAELISSLKNKRFFDSRLRRIAELEAIDSFFVANNYLLKSDAKYFTTLGDFWDYGNRPYRNSGIRSSAVFMPGYYLQKKNDSYTSSSTTYIDQISVNAYLFNAGYELKYEKPINLFWQNSINFNILGGVSHSITQYEEGIDETKLRVPSIQLGYSQSYGFYPNTRTDLRFGYSAQYVKLFKYDGDDEEITGIESRGIKAATNFSLNYYISPKFRLNAYYSLYYVWQKSPDEVNVNFNNIMASGVENYNNIYKERYMNSFFNISLLYTFF